MIHAKPLKPKGLARMPELKNSTSIIPNPVGIPPETTQRAHRENTANSSIKIDKSSLLIGEPKLLRKGQIQSIIKGIIKLQPCLKGLRIYLILKDYLKSRNYNHKEVTEIKIYPILTRMVDKGLIIRMKHEGIYFYFPLIKD